MNICKHVFPHEVQCECCFFGNYLVNGPSTFSTNEVWFCSSFDAIVMWSPYAQNLNDGHLYSEALIWLITYRIFIVFPGF